jgi:hypothetical protein
MKYNKVFYSFSLALVTGFYSVSSLAVPRLPSLISLEFPPTSNRGRPSSTGGGGTRDVSNCINQSETRILSVNALTPKYSNVVTTASQNPTFYFYLPENRAKQGELVITDRNKKIIAQTNFIVPSQPGIIRIQTSPQTALLPNQDYNWSLKLTCESQDPNNNNDVFPKSDINPGILQLKSLTGQLPENATPLQKAEYYAKQGIWLETLDNLAQVRKQYPQEWVELLTSAGLELNNVVKMSDKVFLDCCSAQSIISNQ